VQDSIAGYCVTLEYSKRIRRALLIVKAERNERFKVTKVEANAFLLPISSERDIAGPQTLKISNETSRTHVPTLSNRLRKTEEIRKSDQMHSRKRETARFRFFFFFCSFFFLFFLSGSCPVFYQIYFSSCDVPSMSTNILKILKILRRTRHVWLLIFLRFLQANYHPSCLHDLFMPVF